MNTKSSSSLLWRHSLIVLLVLGSLIALMLQPAIKQDLSYHQFVDARTLFNIPNFYNVTSNLPFLLVGVAGAWFCYRQPSSSYKLPWLCFFIGVGLVCFGSAYYHWKPSNESLVWDRLPMTIGFMGLFAALLGEFITPKLSRYLLFPLIVVGFSSVLVWHWFDDLRFYAWVQFMPLLIIPLLLLLYKKIYTHSYYLMLALFFYLLAKVFETFDGQVFIFFQNEMSGHAIKHVLAALGSLMVLQMLRLRKPKN